MSYWAPKPLRPAINQGLFQFYHPEVNITKGTSIERQRRVDGTPITTGNRTIFSPQDAKLTLTKGTTKVASHCMEDPNYDPATRLQKSREVLKAYMKDNGFEGPVG